MVGGCSPDLNFLLSSVFCFESRLARGANSTRHSMPVPMSPLRFGLLNASYPPWQLVDQVDGVPVFSGLFYSFLKEVAARESWNVSFLALPSMDVGVSFNQAIISHLEAGRCDPTMVVPEVAPCPGVCPGVAYSLPIHEVRSALTLPHLPHLPHFPHLPREPCPCHACRAYRACFLRAVPHYAVATKPCSLPIVAGVHGGPREEGDFGRQF
jgi:hypothetical protein